jgi:hypothetical protein
VAPVSFRLRRPAWWPRRHTPEARDALGILFRVERHVAPGSQIEVAFSFRGQVLAFRGEVVLVRELSVGFEIGLWLADAAAASRARQVEQQYQMDTYLRDRRLREGPYLSRDTVARDWVPEFAGPRVR